MQSTHQPSPEARASASSPTVPGKAGSVAGVKNTVNRVSVPPAEARIVNVAGNVTGTDARGIARVKAPVKVAAPAAVAQVQTAPRGKATLPSTLPLMPAQVNAGAVAAPSLAPKSQPVMVAQAPANLPPVRPEDVPVQGMGKVIKVPSLSLPPLSKPLPLWMQAAAVKLERLEKPAGGPANGTRLAQDPTAAPIRQPANPVTNSDRLPNQIEVATSTFVVLITTTDLQTVAVADPTIADVAVVNSRAVLLNGKTPGVTSLVIVDGQKIRQYAVRVTPAAGTRPVDVAQAIGLPGVSVRPLKDALVLEGEVANAEEAKRAVEIASIYAPKVINQLTVRDTGAPAAVPPETVKAETLKELINNPAVTVRVVGESVILSGTVTSPQQIQDAETVARTVSKDVLNLLRLPALSVDDLRRGLGAAATAPGPEQVAANFGPAPFVIREAGGSVVLEGSVNSAQELELALSQAARTGLPIINRLSVAEKPSAEANLGNLVTAAIGIPGVRAVGSAKRVVLQGIVKDTNQAIAAEQIARAFATQVDNLLLTNNPQTVDVEVAIVEIAKDDARRLGIDYGSVPVTEETTDAAGNPLTRTIDPSTFNQGQVLAANGFGGLGATKILDPMRYRLNALFTNGNSRLLSRPRTTVLSGRTATFQVGGQVPIPVGSTTNASGTSTSLNFKDFGILVDIIPVATQDGAVTMRVKTEISQPDFNLAATVNGTRVPGFSRRVSISEVTVPKGGTLALGGLIQNNTIKSLSKVPFLADIPVLGALFKSKQFERNQTEVAIFVTPTLLPNPMGPGQLAPAAPFAIGNNTNSATVLGTGGADNGTAASYAAVGATAPSATASN